MSASIPSDLPIPRPGILDIEAYVPGESGVPGGMTPIKLSSNETPLGASPKAIAAFQSEGTHLERYPDGTAAGIWGDVDWGPPDHACYKVGLPPNDQSRGILPKFGDVTKPHEGASMVALSSGVAREGRVAGSPYRAMMCRAPALPRRYEPRVTGRRATNSLRSPGR